MSAADPSKILRGVTGRLIGKTSAFTSFATTAYPYGGTQLGLVSDVRLTRTEGTYQVRAEEWGVEVVDDLYLGETWAVTFLMRGFDTALPFYMFNGAAVGTTTSEVVIPSYAAGRLPGFSKGVMTGAYRVAFVPDDVERHPGFVGYRAIPKVARVLDVPFAYGEEQLLAAGFVFVRPSAGSPALRWGPLADITG